MPKEDRFKHRWAVFQIYDLFMKEPPCRNSGTAPQGAVLVFPLSVIYHYTATGLHKPSFFAIFCKFFQEKFSFVFFRRGFCGFCITFC
jgi:hypothetical protein